VYSSTTGSLAAGVSFRRSAGKMDLPRLTVTLSLVLIFQQVATQANKEGGRREHQRMKKDILDQVQKSKKAGPTQRGRAPPECPKSDKMSPFYNLAFADGEMYVRINSSSGQCHRLLTVGGANFTVLTNASKTCGPAGEWKKRIAEELSAMFFQGGLEWVKSENETIEVVTEEGTFQAVVSEEKYEAQLECWKKGCGCEQTANPKMRVLFATLLFLAVGGLSYDSMKLTWEKIRGKKPPKHVECKKGHRMIESKFAHRVCDLCRKSGTLYQCNNPSCYYDMCKPCYKSQKKKVKAAWKEWLEKHPEDKKKDDDKEDKDDCDNADDKTDKSRDDVDSEPANQEEDGMMEPQDARDRTLYEKIFEDHVVDRMEDGTCLIYIDRHLVHEVTSPQAFEGLSKASREVRRPDCTLATVDHNVPTTSRAEFKDVSSFISEPDSRNQCETLEQNVQNFGLTYFGMNDARQGIVHVIGPEQGFTLPGSTVVCGDSHTATHGAFGSIAFGIGTSEVEHVLATQTLLQKQAKTMLIAVDGTLNPGVTSKDVVLHIIGVIGTAGGTGYAIEFGGQAIVDLSIESRMSICNMAIEAGARAGLVAPDDKTFKYLKGRPMAPRGTEWEKATSYWQSLASDPGAKYDIVVKIPATEIAPTVTWGTSPQDVVSITGCVPDPQQVSDPAKKAAMERALTYMGLEPGTKMNTIPVDKVFIGSCTNSRIEDLRDAAKVAKGRKVADNVKLAYIVPGSGLVKKQAEAEGLDKIFKDAGFDWREAGCSMCLGMNPDQLEPKERCASTSNRNFEGRQGAQGRTHLVSPIMAAAAAITGKLTDIRDLVLPTAVELETPASKWEDFVGTNPVPAAPAFGRVRKAEKGNESDNVKPESAGMPKFTVLKGVAAPLDMQNVDTDMIIPKQFLKTIKRTGLGKSAFFEIRYKPDGSEEPDFVLNQEAYRQAKILVCGDNFGCGSSREHAPWAINDFGIRCLISTSFADIFFNNCFKNGMLPIKLGAEDVKVLMEDAKELQEFEVDLHSQKITRANGSSISFDIDAFKKHCLINGFDDIGLTMQKSHLISKFEDARSENFPWLDGAGYKGKKGPTKLTAVETAETQGNKTLKDKKIDW